ncbi:MAG: hypothetical protein IPJ13_23995 [Saprospiraceae bacterium]|nr:hypothetical protein [Saprospiraceae bacterium]
MATRDGNIVQIIYSFKLFKLISKMKTKDILFAWILMVCFVKIGSAQIISPQEYRKLEAKVRLMKQEYNACLNENEKLKEKNDSLMSSTKIITMKSESLHAFESKIKPAIPGGYIQTPINSKLLANMKLYKKMQKCI